MQRFRPLFFFFVALLLSGTLLVPYHASSQQRMAETTHKAFLPLVQNPFPPAPFGFDIRTYSSNEALQLALQTRPKWARVGDVDWAAVEPTQGEYHWEALAAVEANIRRVRIAGIEPVVVIQRSPSWAQSIPGRFCSLPKEAALQGFADFLRALAARYSTGELAVNYWEVWNEPDHSARFVSDDQGVGCQGDPAKPDNNGSFYGRVLQYAYPSLKIGNPNAQVFAGALASFGLNDDRNERFVRGIMSVAPNSFDALSFHAYGEWSSGDLLLFKTNLFRRVMREYGYDKPLVATEVAATCITNAINDCKPSYDVWINHQANYAARIYAEAIALNLMGAFWYTLDSQNPGFAYSHMVDLKDNQLLPRPAFYAFKASSELLAGAKYIGPPLQEPGPDQYETVQVLKFRKAHSTLYVLWVPRLDFPAVYRLEVPPGATAICTQKLEAATPINYYCSDSDSNGVIPLGIISLPVYVEVMD